MSTSSNKQQKKGKDGVGDAGKRKEMVKDRRVQQMYVEGRCVKGVYAIVRKSGVYVCVIESCVKVRMYVYACVYVCVVWPPKCRRYVCMCMCGCACVCVRVYVYELPKQKRIKQWHDKRKRASSSSRPPQ